ncbi:two-component system sensor histidine kinase CpxA [Legionella longbeachae]|uniref:histidine kinase n=1 Tax=Legionella longbeachae serogroup 1 (strain NSW150) TaxID=661367 RepID=D3HTB7_LEGLN|nr:ATP-binding protein [Legionella longbeachae]HBD7397913.1 HAMP domain-containing protein [Legionella pneumophila]ARB91084.1 HAMP domain-containing protein [Legionella longbeachae]ARM32488.1 HAMP domain-containing protein [Legionella longbeachae]EEZ94698.1 sensor histidine kinase CpxA [Legionella longbeachae D-4968]QEY51742.1 HAMP domain-containing protein [Legionella longbeachae]
MRSLYWKIFISFWLATILIIFTTAWIISHIVHKSSLPAQEQLFMDSYANAAVATYESGQQAALLKWLNKIGISRHMSIYLLTSTGEIIGTHVAPENVKKVAENLLQDQLSEGILKSGKLIVSHEILSTSGKFYRLAAVSEQPIYHFVGVPWAGLAIRLILAIFISGLICYLLSRYLTQPLRSLGMAAKSIAKGKLNTRVGHLRGHNKDEIAQLSAEFDRMAEQVETLVKSKERLLQDISHELRSPLARLQIAIELGRKKTNHLADGEFNRMELECSRLNALITEILDFARLEKSTTDLNCNEVDLSTLLLNIINDANFEFGNELPRVKAGVIEPCQLFLDERLIHRAIENVVRNALHYSPATEQVTVSLTRDKTQEHIYIDITDKGPGVPEDQLNRIFNPFYRVDTSRAKKTGGYGLGLAIAARAIQLHQGEIVASNNPDCGLLVRIKLNSSNPEK